jgi:putative two-component system response regulator
MSRQIRGLLAVLTLAAGWWLVRQVGGTYTATTHVMYVPAALGALAWGRAGGALTGVAAGLLVAWTPAGITTAQVQTFLSVAFRSGGYIAVGVVVGFAMDRTQQQHRQMQQLLIQSVEALTNAMGANDQQTARHSLRVAELSAELGRMLRLCEHQLFILRMGSLLHDVGKLAVPREILEKPGRLTPEEYAAAQEHVTAGAAILDAFDHPYIGAVQDVVRHHHERLDGSGYPDRLAGGQISLLARVVAVADVYDALTSNRSYRSRMDHGAAMGILRQEAAIGKLDPRLVEMIDRLPPQAAGMAQPGDLATEAV